MVVYADVILILNFISSYLMLYVVGRIIFKQKISIPRLCLASALGALSALLLFTVRMSYALTLFVRLFSAIIMVICAFGAKKAAKEQLAMIAAMSGMMIAAMLVLTLLSGAVTNITVRNGVIYMDLPPLIFLPMLAVSYAAVTLFFKLLQKVRKRRKYDVKISLDGREIAATALFDSGNMLREPLTGKSVSILEWETGRELFGESGALTDADIAAMKLWAVPYKTIGRKNGIIFAFIADKVTVIGEGKEAEKVFIGLYNGRLSEKGEYNALLNSALL